MTAAKCVVASAPEAESRSLHHIGVEAGDGERFGEEQRRFLIVFDDQQSHCSSP
jgi:hypothetical protein